MWPAWPHQKQVRTTPGARVRSTTMASPALVGRGMEGGARGAGQWLGQEGARGRCWGTGQCCWGKAGLGEGGMVGCGQNWAHGVLLHDDSIEPTLLGIQPFSKRFPLHIGLWHQ